MSQLVPTLWAVVPAAGIGRRMMNETPKQYLVLKQRTVIEWALSTLLARADIKIAMVALAQNDSYWSQLPCAHDARVRTTLGGDERASSVLNALNALSSHAHEDDWVLVHDAARPCLSADDLSRLISELSSDPVGGLLAAPVADTLKAADREQRASATVPRNNIWRAFTPQMFRFGLLLRALLSAIEKNLPVTDESSAIELLGHKPRLIAGRADNIKITTPDDLLTAEQILTTRLITQANSL
jgi:2-C-methyl-D-erythritol 4-phosphate cytidylyltransferase